MQVRQSPHSATLCVDLFKSQMARGRNSWNNTATPQPAAPALQLETFFPPLTMQQSIWNSITDGDFVDAKIFAFTQRSYGRPGQRVRVHAPEALFVNTRVLVNACSFFQSSMSSLLSETSPLSSPQCSISPMVSKQALLKSFLRA